MCDCDPSAGFWYRNDQFLFNAWTRGTTYLSWLRASAVNVDTIIPVQPVSVHQGLWTKIPTKMISPLRGLLTNNTWEVPRKSQSTSWTIRGLSGRDQINPPVIRHRFSRTPSKHAHLYSRFLATEWRRCINSTVKSVSDLWLSEHVLHLALEKLIGMDWALL